MLAGRVPARIQHAIYFRRVLRIPRDQGIPV
jgi:hypothetical protein